MSAEEFIKNLYKSVYIKDSISSLSELYDDFESIKNTHPEYFWWLDDSDFDDLDNLINLIIQAPTMSIKYWLLGKLDLQKNYIMRMQQRGVNHVVS